MLGKMREVTVRWHLKELMRDRESFNAKVFDGSKDDLANLGLELRTFNVQDFSDSQGIIRSMAPTRQPRLRRRPSWHRSRPRRRSPSARISST